MNPTKLLVKAILESPMDLSWSVQGLGMLRTYLSPEVRLHIWDSKLRVPGVSPIHDHPWHLDSLIVAGRLNNQRFKITDMATWRELAYMEKLKFSTILCGEKACTMSEPQETWVRREELETYGEGKTYHQEKDEIHESLPEDGTVTLVTRTFTGDRDHARVFWRGLGEWVDAKPRGAESHEVRDVVGRSLARWFDKSTVN